MQFGAVKITDAHIVIIWKDEMPQLKVTIKQITESLNYRGFQISLAIPNNISQRFDLR